MNLISPDMIGWGMTGLGTMAGAYAGGPGGAAIGAEIGSMAGKMLGGAEQSLMEEPTTSGGYGRGGGGYNDNPSSGN